MLEVGWSEILVIALVLIIVVGPKDLPGMLRNFGRMATRVRKMANEFKGQFDEALREAELDDVRKGIGEVNKLNPTNALRDAMNPIRQFSQDIKSDLQKASDFATKPLDEGTKVDELTADPAIVPEPVTAEPVKTEPAQTEPAKAEAAKTEPVSVIPPAAAMPTISPPLGDAKPKASRKKADVALVATSEALTALPVTDEPARKTTARKKATPVDLPKAETPVVEAKSDPFPPPAKKTVVRKPAEKHTEHNVHVVSAAEPVIAEAVAAPKKPATKKPATAKKTTKTGDA